MPPPESLGLLRNPISKGRAVLGDRSANSEKRKGRLFWKNETVPQHMQIRSKP